MEQGKVVRIQNDRTVVEFTPGTACGKCGARVVCNPTGGGKREIVVENQLHARVGDQVVIEESDGVMLRIIAMQYGVPLLGFLIGVFTAYYFRWAKIPVIPELFYFLGGLAGMFVGGGISYLWATRMAVASAMPFRIVDIITGDSQSMLPPVQDI